MSPSCTIDDITANVNEVDLEVTNEGYAIVGTIDNLDDLQQLIEYLGTRSDSDNTIRYIRIRDDQQERAERCNGISDGVTQDIQQDGSVRFRINIREVPVLGGSQ